MDLKLVKIASVREHMDSHFRGEISYSKAVGLINEDANKQLMLDVSKSKVDKREQAYQKFFRDHPNFRGKAIRYKGNYIFHKDEAYDCIDYYLKTGIEP